MLLQYMICTLFSNSVIKLGSPNLNFLIILGATLLYLSIFFYATSAENFSQQLEETILCNVSRVDLCIIRVSTH